MKTPSRPRRAVPPVKFLAKQSADALKHLTDLIESGWVLIERELERSEPDPEAHVLMGSLSKALEDQYTRDQARRALHRAPTQDEPLAKVLGAETYDVPTVFEPLAELARSLTEDEFDLAVRKLPSEEEQSTRADAATREEHLYRTWRLLLAKHGGDPERAQADSTWGPIDQLATQAAVLADLVQERWDRYRAAARTALRKAAEYHTEDGLEPTPLKLRQLYARATRAGELKGAEMNYAKGETVEVRDPTGRWRRADVTNLDPTRGTVTVLREDGQKRTLTYQSDVRSMAEANLLLDEMPEKAYNSHMDTLIKRFNVTLPSKSTSQRIEEALEPITAEMNANPLSVNAATWERNFEKATQTRDELNAVCHQMTGNAFRPNASADCAKILFGDLGLTPRRVNPKSGEPSTDQSTLQALHAEGVEIAGAIMAARSAQSELSQLEAWEPFAKAGRVQTTWNSLGTPMGRYTAAEPNLQNRIREIRETIEAPPGYHLQSFDLGQAEYCVWSSLSGDVTLAKAFADGHDFHRTMYEELRKAAPDVDLHNPDPRQAGKTINFALLYLMQANVLAQQLGIPGEEGARLIKAYGERAPTAVKYREQVLDQFHVTGTVETKFGRRRELTVPVGRVAIHEANKTAWHHHNSGTAAELLKIKQVKLHRALRREGLEPADARIALQMHDELILLVRNERKDQVAALGLEKFHEPIPGFIPFKIDHRIGPNWLAISK